ncbi:hypothetical protein EDB83DRAFT_2520871 [Lactarius deliciosus]|nr:hypothetical protein EDB83DRAFT_2520871 [Lactarius deliciosus]
MSQNPLGILKKGFAEFLGKIKARKDKLNAKLSWGEAISLSDEQWLDNEGNAVNEHRILEVLESAPDYERAVAELDNNRKAIVSKLREWAGALTKVARNKQKCPDPKKEKHLEKGNKKKMTPSAPIFTKKENATLAQWIEILDWHHKNGRNQSATARHFIPLYLNLQIKQPLISSWLKDKAKWHKQWQESNHQGDQVAK